MLPRFYAPHLDPRAASVALDAGESRHLARVLRLRAGARVRVFDGRGTEFLAEVAASGRAGATLTLVERAAAARETTTRITLAQALLKGDAMDAVIRDATMLGVAAIQPFVATRSNVSLAAARRGRMVDRWRRIAVASCKQCGRAVVPGVRAPLDFDELLALGREDLRLILVEPSAAVGESEASPYGSPRPAAATLAMGPEGGWTAEEIARARAHGMQPWTLGARTLRADAAPIVALSVLLFVWGDL